MGQTGGVLAELAGERYGWTDKSVPDAREKTRFLLGLTPFAVPSHYTNVSDSGTLAFMFGIDLASGEPLEHQIHRELRRVIAAGEVVAGDRLPSARQLAADLGVHWNTVARAYRRLGEEGLATVGRGRAVVVRKSEADGSRAAKRLPAHLRELVTEARLAGLTRTELESAMASEMDRWQWRMGQ